MLLESSVCSKMAIARVTPRHEVELCDCLCVVSVVQERLGPDSEDELTCIRPTPTLYASPLSLVDGSPDIDDCTGPVRINDQV